jgi:site-specific recombinase XerD
MNSDTGLIAPLVQSFFTDHLVRQRRASTQTVASYRDTFRLLIQHLSQTTGKKPSDLMLDDLQAKAIMRFLDAIERDRGNSVQTRNARLAAIRSFFRLVTLREPTRLDLAAQVLAIPTKRADRRLIGYLTRPEMDALLATPSTQTWIGKRDYALLLTLYNTGARISEILTLRQHQLAFGATSLLHLKGKGRKERSVPLWPTTSRTLRAWVTECGDSGDRILFPNARGGPLSTDGATYILQQAVRRALPASPTLKAKRISPHVIRHYLPSRIMSSSRRALKDLGRNCRMRWCVALAIARHSPTPATDC